MARKKESRDEKRGRGQINQQQGYQPYQQADGQRVYDPYQQAGAQQQYQQGYDPYQQAGTQQYQQMNGSQGYDPYRQQHQQGYDPYQQAGAQQYQQMNGQQGYDPYRQMNGGQNYGSYQQQPYSRQSYPNRDVQDDTARKKKKKRKTRKIVMFVIEVILLLVLAAGLYVAATFSKLETEVLENEEEIKQQVVEQLDEQVVEKLSGYWNIALYGVDSRVGETETGTRTDTIMIVSINRDTKDVKLVSVYRDTYLDNTDGSYRKATECYEAGGPSRSINMLNKNFDLDITNYVTVDMSVVAEVVDLVGGVEIEILPEEIEHLNNYQVEGSTITGKDQANIYEAGLQTLNGLQAVSYCRVRQVGNDYQRTERQRTVLGKVFEKVQNMDLFTLTGMIDDLLPYISTNLTKTEILSLAKDVASYKIGETTGFPFTKVSLKDLGYIIAPATLESNVVELHEFLFGADEAYTPSQTVKEISDYIINYTGVYEE